MVSFVFLLCLALSTVPAAAAEKTPAAKREAVQSAGAGDARAKMLEWLKANPDEIRLHEQYQSRLAGEPEGPVKLEAEYRAYLAQDPSSPVRHLLLAMALTQSHRNDGSRAWVEEDEALIDSVLKNKDLAPWALRERAEVARTLGDSEGYKQIIEKAWEAAPGHQAIAADALMLACEEKNEEKAAEIVRTAMALDPVNNAAPLATFLRFGPSRLTWSEEPTPERERLLRQVVKAAKDAAAAKPEDRRLQQVLLMLDRMTGGEGRPSRPPADQDADIREKIATARFREPRAAVRELEALVPEVGKDPRLAGFLFGELSMLYSLPPFDDKAKALEFARKSLQYSPDSVSGKRAFAELAGETGSALEEALRFSGDVLTSDISQTRSEVPSQKAGDWWEGRSTSLAGDYAAQGLIRYRLKDLQGARRDLLTAVLLDPGRADRFLQLGRIEAALGHSDDALAACLRALALGLSGPEDVKFARSLVENGVKGRYAWLDADDLIAVEKSRLEEAGTPRTLSTVSLLGKPAPDFTAPLLTGGAVSRASLKGKPAVLSFWATWCIPCRAELDILEKLQTRYAQDGVAFIALSVDPEGVFSNAAPAFVKKHGYTMPFARMSEEGKKAFAAARSVPVLYVLDRQGVVRYQHRGYSSDLESSLTKLLDEMK
jgi:cytochrome c biogenesis protein CcmG/thiol:disulfide interchange protein DsbE